MKAKTMQSGSFPIILFVLCVLFVLTPMVSMGGSKKSRKSFELDKSHTPGYQGEYIRMAYNFFIIYDPSTAMTIPYKDTGMTRLEKSKEILIQSNATLPELAWQSGLYPHWKNVMWVPSSPFTFHPYYRTSNWEKEKFAQALEELPIIKSGPPMLQMSLMKLEYLLGLPGRTEIFMFSNGEDAIFEGVEEPEPVAQAKMLAENYDVCFNIVSSATSEEAEKVLYDIAGVNNCSQVLDFDTVAAHPDHLLGKLYMEADGAFPNILFDFDKSFMRRENYAVLNELGEFLEDTPLAYTVLSGFTDSTGAEKYNVGLSQRRAESARAYLLKNYSIKKDRILLHWYGYANPAATNATEKGRQKNRRVVIMLREKV